MRSQKARLSEDRDQETPTEVSRDLSALRLRPRSGKVIEANPPLLGESVFGEGPGDELGDAPSDSDSAVVMEGRSEGEGSREGDEGAGETGAEGSGEEAGAEAGAEADADGDPS